MTHPTIIISFLSQCLSDGAEYTSLWIQCCMWMCRQPTRDLAHSTFLIVWLVFCVEW